MTPMGMRPYKICEKGAPCDNLTCSANPNSERHEFIILTILGIVFIVIFFSMTLRGLFS